ncbi:leucine-rich repeat-containing protein 27-like isoform X10 [Crassostrea angulata]|uniref:leucine-rich repeat-containing protein 27-like isoform X10 n=1 Tax=Magallana angulata TaxID=2784310 RepID=UPI0022B0D2E3|nr:leucine-rich repeat-containing protein 27-like isoform X10 [Crassostrea angulata]
MKIKEKLESEMATLDDHPDIDNLDIGDNVDESSESEIDRLDLYSPGLDSPTERGVAKTKKDEDLILKIIKQTRTLGSNTLELCDKKMLQIPRELLEMNNLEYLYLEGNELTSLPDDFFDCLPRLTWLDLRRNKLLRLPSVYTGRHNHLRTLLLEGNKLRSLPLELGLIKSLNGLNISNNPIEFPPKDIMEKGTAEILKFLREMLQAKSSGQLLNGSPGNGSSSSSDDWDDGDDLQDYAKRRQRTLALDDAKSTTTKSSDPFGPVPQPVALHRPVSYTDKKQEKAEKVRRAGASGTVESRKKSAASVMNWKVNPYPEPPPEEYANFKMTEERKLAKVKEHKQKTDAIIQRRKDDEVLKDWRVKTKKIQQKKHYESMVKGTKDYTDAVEKAPFDIDKNHMKIPTNEERIKEDVKNAHEKVRRAMSPTTRQRVEEEKQTRIRELERRIKQHTSLMHERRKLPKGTPQEEMEAARRELEIVKSLQKDLLKRYQELKAWTTGLMYRQKTNAFYKAEDLHKELVSTRKNLEYRFKAFTGELSTGNIHRRNRVPKI